MENSLLVGASALALATVVAAPFFASWLGDGDTLFTKIKPGRVKLAMAGDDLRRIHMSFPGRHLNVPGSRRYDNDYPAWEVIPHPEGADDSYDERPMWMRNLGLYYVGIPFLSKVYTYKFVWNEVEVDFVTHKEGIVTRKELTNFAFTSAFPYIIVLNGAETSEGIPLDITYQVSIRITNPKKALIDTVDWLQTVTGELQRAGRSYIGSQTYKELLSEVKRSVSGTEETPEDQDESHEFSTELIKLTDEMSNDPPNGGKYEKGLRGRFGITIDAANMQSMEIVGSYANELVKASVEEYTSKQKAIAIENVANAEANAITLKGTASSNVVRLMGAADADALKSRLFVMKKFGDFGALLAQLDAMSAEGPNKTVIWANNPLVREYPGLDGALNKAGIATAEGLMEYIRTTIEEVMRKEAA